MALQTEIDAAALLEPFVEAAREAGEIALGYFRPGERTHATVQHKAGGSPVTEADLLVDRFLEKRLRRHRSGGRMAFRGESRLARSAEQNHSC